METPIVDFVRRYADSNRTRFHMPGHKGHVFFGCEPFDITEIKGADVLHHGSGIILESQKNAARLFGSGATHYSTEGSSLCIKAMLGILRMERGGFARGERPCILAARNVHRSMVDACALLDFDIRFLYPEESGNICSSIVTPRMLDEALRGGEVLPAAVYLTSPDYLGQMADIAGLAEVSGRWGIPLLVDNAHGAYLHFLEQRQHPMDLGAAMCCDSAHKTLPALTGAAYLHIHRDCQERFGPYAAHALSLFGSTSPSYLLLQSLDLCNAYLAGEYRGELMKLTARLSGLRDQLRRLGISVRESEPLKIVIDTASAGYDGEIIAEEMREFAIECEYADRQNVVLMVTVENEEKDWDRLLAWAESSVLVRAKREGVPGSGEDEGGSLQAYHGGFLGGGCGPEFVGGKEPQRVMTVREAVFAEGELVPVCEAVNRICASETVSCPPAVPIAVSGERITGEMAEEFLRFGIREVLVVKQP